MRLSQPLKQKNVSQTDGGVERRDRIESVARKRFYAECKPTLSVGTEILLKFYRGQHYEFNSRSSKHLNWPHNLLKITANPFSSSFWLEGNDATALTDSYPIATIISLDRANLASPIVFDPNGCAIFPVVFSTAFDTNNANRSLVLGTTQCRTSGKSDA